jgi:hypothetical protein
VSGVLFFLKRWKKYFEIFSGGKAEVLLQALVFAWACAACKYAYTCAMAFSPFHLS